MMNQINVPRSHVRTEVGIDIRAKIRTADRSGVCSVENISPGGARVTTRIPLERGQEIFLDINDIGTVNAKVAWINRNTYGLKFSTDMDAIADLLLAVAIY
jgi:hypothetical protein